MPFPKPNLLATRLGFSYSFWHVFAYLLTAEDQSTWQYFYQWAFILRARYAWFPALCFRSSVQIESSSIFRFPLLPRLELRSLGSAGNSPASPLGQPGYWQFDTPIRRTRRRNGITETDERKRIAGNQALATIYYCGSFLYSVVGCERVYRKCCV